MVVINGLLRNGVELADQDSGKQKLFEFEIGKLIIVYADHQEGFAKVQ